MKNLLKEFKAFASGGNLIDLAIGAAEYLWRVHWDGARLARASLDGEAAPATGGSGQTAAQALARWAPNDPRLSVLGPAPAPLSKLRGQYRYRLLVKTREGIHLQRTLRQWLSGQKFKGVRIKLDVNPYYFM